MLKTVRKRGASLADYMAGAAQEYKQLQPERAHTYTRWLRRLHKDITMKYLVQYNVKYSLLVEAESKEKAITQAEKAPADDWDKGESTFEAEAYNTEGGAPA